jgi:hypothetical protein
MPTHLLTISSAHPVDQGIRLSPGIRPSEMADRPAIANPAQGAALELRTPSGARHQTTLLTYGVEVERGQDGTIYMRDDPSDPEIKLTIPSDLPPQACAAGTEVWLLAD